MSFLYPLGLLGLIGIPILIIIYIIKNKYTEQTVASTYIWTYSERFLKKKKKLPKMAGLISLILQILAVTAISLTIANPVFTFPNAAHEYTFILDASGSMGAKRADGTTRFDAAKAEISSIIEESENGSVFNLVCVGDDATEEVFTRLDDKELAAEKLGYLTVSEGAIDLTDAIGQAQKIFDDNDGALTYFITDTSYEKHENVTVINVSESEENYALSSPAYTVTEGASANVLNASAELRSYGTAAELTVEFYLDDSLEPASAKTVSLPAGGEAVAVEFEVEITGFTSFRIAVPAADAIAADNELIVYNTDTQNAPTILIVSDTPYFLESILESVTGVEVRVYSGKEFGELEADGLAPTGYGLYVFDAYTPAELPRDGAVWFFGLTSSVEGAGFHWQGESTLDEGVYLELTDDSSTLAQKLTSDMSGTNLFVYKYMKYGFNDVTEIYTYNLQPIVFTLENSYENREVVFAFSLHDSNFPLLPDFPILVRNLVDYSFPDVIERSSYVSGEALEINVPASCTNIQIEAPDGTVPETILTSAAANEYVLDAPGTYTIILTIDSGDASNPTVKRLRVFTELGDEGNTAAAAEDFSLSGAAGDEGLDGIYDDILVIVIALAVLFSADWGVYCYDKYQLR